MYDDDIEDDEDVAVGAPMMVEVKGHNRTPRQHSQRSLHREYDEDEEDRSYLIIPCSSKTQVTKTSYFPYRKRRSRVRDRMVVGFTTTYAINAYHHRCCEFESRSGRGVQHYVIKSLTWDRSVVFSDFFHQ